MYKNKKIVVVMPAYNASSTLAKTLAEIPRDLVDDIILCDDASKDDTVALAKNLAIDHIIVHDKNKGYGGNQKSLYNKALEINADIVIMLHPDYQYTPMLIPSMVNIIGDDLYPVVLGSRILGKGALKGGMPLYKYISNRLLTAFQNFMLSYKLSEYHTGYRAFSSTVIKSINFNANSDDFVFDNQMLSQIIFKGFDIAEVTCPTKYFKEASSINFQRSVKYGLGVLSVSALHFLCKTRLMKSVLYQ
jgi:glycosyltransferase involved in cell wall biosynthesis